MNEKLSINQVEKITGVSKRNIRFYEKEGLLLPKRNSENGYRVYDESDIWRIKVIKMLRMLDMPLEEIQKVLEEDRSLSEAIVNQQAELEQKARELQAAIYFCEQIKAEELDTLDVDQCLRDIENDNCEGFFKLWVNDYKRVKEANRNMDFTFVPDTPITNEREFTDALFAYANQENVNLVITKESMYPEFTIDGVEYTAMRYYGNLGRVPTAVVRCERKDREIKGEGVTEERRIFQWVLHKYGWGTVLLILIIIGIIPVFWENGITWQGIFIFVGLLITEASFIYRDIILHFNDKTK
jgi:DNA-binding transcriptional MerR regulator